MTAKEQLFAYKELRNNGQAFFIDNYEDADRIIESLEKQIPKELVNVRKVKEYDGYDMGDCPICGEPLDNSFYEKIKYCFVCGQAIKWDE